MPELPEVATIQKQLKHFLPLTIDDVHQTKELKKNILHTKLDLKNKTIHDISRQGKMLIFHLSDSSQLLSHLGMTGTWLIGNNLLAGKHSHLILNCDKNIQLIYDDPRRFGHLYHLENKLAQKKIASLGLDLASPDLDVDYVRSSLKRYPHRALKVTLLDQKLFAGSGNYIANEICARAKILPTKKCHELKNSDFPKILQAIHDVLQPALASGGTTFQGGYRDTSGQQGLGVNHLVVFYQKICKMCLETPVQKIQLAQRGTYFCPRCQK